MLKAHAILTPAEMRNRAAADTVVLDYENRRRRRGLVEGVRGLRVLVDLAASPTLPHGGGLLMEDGRVLEVLAAPEPLMEARGRDHFHLMRLAWHVGNRHLETEIGPRWLRLRRDAVIAAMLRGLGAAVRDVEAPFQPEGGAYEGGHGHSHPHGHGHHRHAHHDHAHDGASHSHPPRG